MDPVKKTLLNHTCLPRPEQHNHGSYSFELNIHGSDEYQKLSYPVKYGQFSRIKTPEAIFEFNRNHEIRHAQSHHPQWRHPQEWLKRTPGNDWVYYSTGGYAGVFEAIGEYYLPNLTYPTNSLLGGKPFEEPAVSDFVTGWYNILEQVAAMDLVPSVSRFLENVLFNTPARLQKKADQLFNILGSRVSVMPPDARHVDYNIIPLHISDGCLYKCRFCKVKNKNRFQAHSKSRLRQNIGQLKSLYARDIANYNAIFLGEHDALNAPGDLILYAAQKAFDEFEFQASFMKHSFLFLFGSVDSFMAKDSSFFQELNRLPYITYINIGLESCDPDTLKKLGKPITDSDVKAAFKKIQTINRQFPNIEITCNFVMDHALSRAHYDSLFELIRNWTDRPRPKGTVYLSPLAFGQPSRQVLYDFYRLKTQSRFPTFLYIIQRL